MINPNLYGFGYSADDVLKNFHDRQKSRTSRSATISDDIVDVEFEYISKDDQSSKKDKNCTFDMEARSREIVEAGDKLIMERLKDASSDKQMVGLCSLMVFSLGAEWADGHPKSSFSSDQEWCDALTDKVEELTKDAPDMGFSGKLVFNMSFVLGAKWVYQNPPKYDS